MQSLTEFDGCAYYLDNGQLKYYIETKNGLQLHAFFQDGSPEYTEYVFDIDLDSADLGVNSIRAYHVYDQWGADVGDWFVSLTFTFSGNTAVMDVVRDESTLAGSATGTIMTGKYVMTKG